MYAFLMLIVAAIAMVAEGAPLEGLGLGAGGAGWALLVLRGAYLARGGGEVVPRRVRRGLVLLAAGVGFPALTLAGLGAATIDLGGPRHLFAIVVVPFALPLVVAAGAGCTAALFWRTLDEPPPEPPDPDLDVPPDA